MDLKCGRPHVLDHRPSLLCNNLSWGTRALAYVSLGKAVMKETGNHVNSKAQRDTVLIIKSGGTAKAHQVSFVNLGGMEVLVVALSSGVQIWNASGDLMLYFLSLGDRKDSSPSHGHFCRGIACMPGGDALLVGCSDGEVFVICASSHDKIELAQTLRGHTAPVTCAAASSEYAATGDSVGRIIVWDACDHFSRICNITCEGYPVTSMAMRRGLLVVAMGNGVVRMYSAKIGDLCVEVGAHSRCCNAIDIHPNFPIVVTAGEDDLVNIWSLPDDNGGDDATGGSDCELLFSASAKEGLLTGARFIPGEFGRKTCLAVTAYDSTRINIWAD